MENIKNKNKKKQSPNKDLNDSNNTLPLPSSKSNNYNSNLSNKNNTYKEKNFLQKNLKSINSKNDISLTEKDQKEKEKELEMTKLEQIQITNIIIKLLIVLMGFGIWILYRFTLQHDDRKWDFIYCFEDRLLTKFFLPYTNYISQNLYIRDFLLIISSAFLDIFMVSFLIIFTLKGNSWNPLVHMGLFYGFRGAVIQSLIIMEIYDTYIFEYPGFPSLIVPYFRAADFFYSGHSGCAVLLGLQLSDMGYSELKYVGFILGIFEGFVLTILRIHYSIDIIFGIIVSHYLYYVSRHVSKYMDIIYPMGEYNEELIDSNSKLNNNNTINCEKIIKEKERKSFSNGINSSNTQFCSNGNMNLIEDNNSNKNRINNSAHEFRNKINEIIDEGKFK